jgi:hypothetical protein
MLEKKGKKNFFCQICPFPISLSVSHKAVEDGVFLLAVQENTENYEFFFLLFYLN